MVSSSSMDHMECISENRDLSRFVRELYICPEILQPIEDTSDLVAKHVGPVGAFQSLSASRNLSFTGSNFGRLGSIVPIWKALRNEQRQVTDERMYSKELERWVTKYNWALGQAIGNFDKLDSLSIYARPFFTAWGFRFFDHADLSRQGAHCIIEMLYTLLCNLHEDVRLCRLEVEVMPPQGQTAPRLLHDNRVAQALSNVSSMHLMIPIKPLSSTIDIRRVSWRKSFGTLLSLAEQLEDIRIWLNKDGEPLNLMTELGLQKLQLSYLRTIAIGNALIDGPSLLDLLERHSGSVRSVEFCDIWIKNIDLLIFGQELQMCTSLDTLSFQGEIKSDEPAWELIEYKRLPFPIGRCLSWLILGDKTGLDGEPDDFSEVEDEAWESITWGFLEDELYTFWR